MLTLFDPRFAVEYTDDERVVIYRDGTEIVKKKVPGLMFEPDLKQAAISLLNAKYMPVRYRSLAEVANDCGVTRQALSLRLKDMIHGVHYIKGDMKMSGVIITPEGYELLTRYYREKEKTAE